MRWAPVTSRRHPDDELLRGIKDTFAKFELSGRQIRNNLASATAAPSSELRNPSRDYVFKQLALAMALEYGLNVVTDSSIYTEAESDE
jgi:hypothetical protein